MGYVRVAFGALYVQSHCSLAVTDQVSWLVRYVLGRILHDEFGYVCVALCALYYVQSHVRLAARARSVRLVRYSLGRILRQNLVTFAWRLVLSMLRVQCSWAAVPGQYWLVRFAWGEYCGGLGYVRVAYGALNVERQVFVGCRDELLLPVETPQVQFLGCWLHARGDSTGAVPGEVVFMPVACRQCWGTTVQKTVEFPQLQCCHGGRCPCLCSSSTDVDVPVWGSCWRCPRLSSSPELVDFPVSEAGVSSWADGDDGVGAHHIGDGAHHIGDELNQWQ